MSKCDNCGVRSQASVLGRLFGTIPNGTGLHSGLQINKKCFLSQLYCRHSSKLNDAIRVPVSVNIFSAIT